jgi:hypothetical protein
MRAVLSAFIVTSVLLSAGYVAATAQQTKRRVKVTEINRDALAKVKTYTWTASHPSFDKAADKQIIAAVDRELMTRGLTRLATGRGDAEVTYASLSRTDVDLKSEPLATGERRTYPVGILVVQVRDSANGQMLFNAKVHSPIDTEPAKLEATINAATAAIFKKFPGHPAAKD